LRFEELIGLTGAKVMFEMNQGSASIVKLKEILRTIIPLVRRTFRFGKITIQCYINLVYPNKYLFGGFYFNNLILIKFFFISTQL
jgi:hypothetical protein